MTNFDLSLTNIILVFEISQEYISPQTLERVIWRTLEYMAVFDKKDKEQNISKPSRRWMRMTSAYSFKIRKKIMSKIARIVLC